LLDKACTNTARSDNRLSAVSDQQSAVSDQRSAIGHQLSAISYQGVSYLRSQPSAGDDACFRLPPKKSAALEATMADGHVGPYNPGS
jgi:hypothetical protein